MDIETLKKWKQGIYDSHCKSELKDINSSLRRIVGDMQKCLEAKHSMCAENIIISKSHLAFLDKCKVGNQTHREYIQSKFPGADVFTERKSYYANVWIRYDERNRPTFRD